MLFKSNPVSVDTYITYHCFKSYKHSYHSIDMNTSILLVKSQVILHHITVYKSRNILKCTLKVNIPTRKEHDAFLFFFFCSHPPQYFLPPIPSPPHIIQNVLKSAQIWQSQHKNSNFFLYFAHIFTFLAPLFFPL